MTEAFEKEQVTVPAMGLIVLVGVSGSGKSTFARAHFKPTEVVSSDFCRGLVADDENDQSATSDAFDVLNYIVGTRLRRGLLTVVDATNVQQAARASLIELAKSHDVLVDAIVIDVPESVAFERNKQRPGRDFGSHVVSRQHRDLRRSLGRLNKEGFRRVHVLRGTERIESVEIVRERPWNDRTDVHGPFDIIGDIHGCASELRSLLTTLGWEIQDDGDIAVSASHADGRRAVFVGDLVDRGPDTPGVLRLVMGMVEAGTALCVSGNHEAKLVRALRGSKVTVSHGLAESLTQMESESDEFRKKVLDFMDGLISHYVLDDGKLVVAHAGLKESYHGRSSGRVRAFALYGDTSGETDEYGLPVRYPWAQEYRGKAMVVYGHTPVPKAEWIKQHDLPGHRSRLRWLVDSPALPRARARLDPGRTGVVRAGPPPRRLLRRPRAISVQDQRRRRHALAGDHPRRQGEDPRRERCGGARSDESFRSRPALAHLPATDDVASRDIQARRIPGAPGAGVR